MKASCRRRNSLGLTLLQVREAAFNFAEGSQVKHPWNTKNRVAGIDWFLAFLTRHSNSSVREPECLSRARAQELNRQSVAHFFGNLKKVTDQFELCDKPYNVSFMDECGFPLNNRPSKIVCQKGK